MTAGIKVMYDLGFIDTTDKHDKDIVRQFTKYDNKGYITDTINFFYVKESGVQLFANNIRNGCGSGLDKYLLNAINLNMLELEMELENE